MLRIVGRVSKEKIGTAGFLEWRLFRYVGNRAHAPAKGLMGDQPELGPESVRMFYVFYVCRVFYV